jgi:predicted metal-dependent hydrolase
METEWGSFKRETRNICFSVDLAKKHTECLERLIVPAMTHLIESSPGPRFKQLRDKNFPDSQSRLDQVNGVQLGHQQWGWP